MTTATPDALHDFLRDLPKVELHCHLYGTVRRETYADLAHKAGAPLSDDEIAAFYTRGEKPVGVLRALRALDQYLVTGAADLHRITREYLQDAAAHRVRYAEFFWNPTGTVRDSHIPYAAAQDVIVQAIREAERESGIVGRLVVAIDRESSPDEAVEMVGWAAARRCDEVVGLGIDYNEVQRPPELFWKAYRDARRAGFKLTAHAGEFGMPWTNVETVIDLLGVDRVDHGYTIVEHLPLVERCRDAGLVFAVVPTNSYYLRTLAPERWALDHPIRRMLALGLRLHPNTDDPTLHHVTPTGAWLMMARDFGCTIEDLRDCMLAGLDAAWIDDGLRRRWRQEFSAHFDRGRASLGAPQP